MGDPQNPPILKAASGFSADVLVDGYDSELATLVQLAGMADGLLQVQVHQRLPS
jgi:hypothetical protein